MRAYRRTTRPSATLSPLRRGEGSPFFFDWIVFHALTESELLPVSALQHLLFCERQCALIHLEQQWAENRLTALGRIEHERVDEGYREFRRDRRQISGLHVRSLGLLLYGRLDVLELDLIDKQGPDNAVAFGLMGKWLRDLSP